MLFLPFRLHCSLKQFNYINQLRFWKKHCFPSPFPEPVEGWRGGEGGGFKNKF